MVAVRKNRICRSYGAFSFCERRATMMPRRRRSESADAKRSRKSSSRICKPASGVNEIFGSENEADLHGSDLGV